MIIQWLGPTRVPAGPGKPLIICDRDGTLTLDTGVPHSHRDLVLNMSTIEVLVEVRSCDATLAMASNQAAIGRGSASLESVTAFNQELSRQMADHGLQLTLAVFCPHQPHQSSDPSCNCRKPRPSMLEACLALVQPSSAVMLGDARSDLAAAQGAGLRGLLVQDPSFNAGEIRRILGQT